LLPPDARREVELALDRVRRSYRLCVYGYVIMPEHVHLLLGDGDHFWQKRYYDFNIRDRKQFIEKLRYIHRKSGLVAHPKEWEWSSFRHYATGIKRIVEIESEWTARERERTGGQLCPRVLLPHSSNTA